MAGLQRLTGLLAENHEVRKNTVVTKIEKNDLWQLRSGDDVIQCSTLVIALPVNSALQLLSHLSSPPVSSIPGARIVNVLLGFSEKARIPRGFGYLAPEREKRFTMGADAGQGLKK